ncbi:hypothetical protein [Mariniflexile sp.]|uniref:hypothetical protein n=1 Tax=Mariniflexile sp. TaxID=1979402 RepID=UPI003567506B
MRKIIILIVVLCFISIDAQNLDNLGERSLHRIIITPNNEIKGKDYIYNEWNKGELFIKDSVVMKQEFLKYDVYNDRILIKFRDNPIEIVAIEDEKIKGFVIFDSGLNHYFVMLDGINFVDTVKNGYYEILGNNFKSNFLIKKNIKVVFDPNRSKGSQTINNLPLEFQDKTIYYLKNADGLYEEVRLKEKDFMQILNSNQEATSNFIKENKLRFTKEEDVIKIVDYYYSL